MTTAGTMTAGSAVGRTEASMNWLALVMVHPHRYTYLSSLISNCHCKTTEWCTCWSIDTIHSTPKLWKQMTSVISTKKVWKLLTCNRCMTKQHRNRQNWMSLAWTVQCCCTWLSMSLCLTKMMTAMSTQSQLNSWSLRWSFVRHSASMSQADQVQSAVSCVCLKRELTTRRTQGELEWLVLSHLEFDRLTRMVDQEWHLSNKHQLMFLIDVIGMHDLAYQGIAVRTCRQLHCKDWEQRMLM